jgi:hypothetical protein
LSRCNEAAEAESSSAPFTVEIWEAKKAIPTESLIIFGDTLLIILLAGAQNRKKAISPQGGVLTGGPVVAKK